MISISNPVCAPTSPLVEAQTRWAGGVKNVPSRFHDPHAEPRSFQPKRAASMIPFEFRAELGGTQ